ncbi:hypothetical protein AVEN_208659-1 [Araneus ventricosus]|uniref:Uncharacterized protein n=1 Tax=Araneus ventricosus TaxID=182803 RepID=A0A4Y2DU17_ARAVE|nr:hypothetical protein AVEN_208659-1 [Araneus ventricosus]
MKYFCCLGSNDGDGKMEFQGLSDSCEVVQSTETKRRDLMPCDFFPLGYLKDQVYRHNPQTIAELEQYISDACQTIPNEMFARASANFVLRRHHVVVANGGYFENVLL